jgi:hypothetical protein
MTATATTDTSAAAPTVGELRELARYTTATGTERALGGGERAYLLEQGLEQEGHGANAALDALIADRLADAAKTHLTHPFGASTTSRSSLEEISQDEAFNRGLTGARARLSEIDTALQAAQLAAKRTGLRPGRSFAGLSTTRSSASEPTRSGRRSYARRHGDLSSCSSGQKVLRRDNDHRPRRRGARDPWAAGRERDRVEGRVAWSAGAR